jgi:hypothetical protein
MWSSFDGVFGLIKTFAVQRSAGVDACFNGVASSLVIVVSSEGSFRLSFQPPLQECETPVAENLWRSFEERVDG